TQWAPRIAASDGDWAVVWENTEVTAVVGRRLDGDGTPLGAMLTLGSSGTRPDVESSAAGWTATWRTNAGTIRARTIALNGALGTNIEQLTPETPPNDPPRDVPVITPELVVGQNAMHAVAWFRFLP